MANLGSALVSTQSHKTVERRVAASPNRVPESRPQRKRVVAPLCLIEAFFPIFWLSRNFWGFLREKSAQANLGFLPVSGGVLLLQAPFQLKTGPFVIVKHRYIEVLFDVLQILVREIASLGQNKFDVFLADFVHFVACRVRELHEEKLKAALDKKIVFKITVRFFDAEVEQSVKFLVALDHLIIDLEFSELGT